MGQMICSDEDEGVWQIVLEFWTDAKDREAILAQRSNCSQNGQGFQCMYRNGITVNYQLQLQNCNYISMLLKCKRESM